MGRLGVAALVLSASLLAACGSDDDGGTASGGGGSEGGGSLVILSAGGSYEAGYHAAYFQPFATASGVNIERVQGGDDPVAQVRAQVESGNVLWDLVSCGPGIVAANPDLWEPVDTDIVTGTNDLVYDLVGEQHVGTDVEAFPLFAYANEAFPDGGPESWADFYDTEAFPGPRGVPNVGLDSAWSVPASALLADGVEPDDLFPLDLDRAYDVLDAVKDDVRVFWTTFGQSADILRSGEVAANLMTDGRAQQLIAQGVEVTPVFDGSFRFTGSWCVPKGAPNAENAWKLLQYIFEHPEQQAVFVQLTGFGPPTEAGIEAAKELGVEDFSSLHVDEMIPDSDEILAWIAENDDELLNRYNAWLEG